jgi:hypothetical protein
MATESLSPDALALGSARLPFAEQAAFFKQKMGTLLPTEKWTDVIHEAHDRGVVVAGAMKADLLADFAKAIDGFVSRGENMTDFVSRFDDLVDKHGWNFQGDRDFRIRTIYQTNLATSYAAGRLVLLKRAAADGLLWMYKHSDLSITPRPLHRAWNGLCLSPNDPWWFTHYPPNGWGCKCYVVAVHPSNVARLGGRIAPAPDDGSRSVTLGGRTLVVPKGIDPGWAYMPGASVADDLRAIVDGKVAKLPAPLGKAFKEEGAGVVAKPEKPAATPNGAVATPNGAIPAKTGAGDNGGVNEEEKAAFATWSQAVIGENYRARHEFRRAGQLPGFVLDDADVSALEPRSADIHISDYQLRHSLREIKSKRGASLPLSVLASLPDELESARWFFDSRHKNLLAAFSEEIKGKTGKAVVSVNFHRGKADYNAITTTGLIEPFNLSDPSLREILEGIS